MFSFLPLMASFNGVPVLLPLQPKTVAFFSVFLPTLSFLACICIHSRQTYLASAMPGPADATVKHTCTYVLAHPRTCAHVRANPSLYRIYVLVEEDRQFLESSIKSCSWLSLGLVWVSVFFGFCFCFCYFGGCVFYFSSLRDLWLNYFNFTKPLQTLP